MKKTKMCDFHMEGRCKYGSDCAFAHNEIELQGIPDLRKTKICHAFTQGKCNDSECKFAHGSDELRRIDLSALLKQGSEGKALKDGGDAEKPEDGAASGGEGGPVAKAKGRKRMRARRRRGRGGGGGGGAKSGSPGGSGDEAPRPKQLQDQGEGQGRRRGRSGRSPSHDGPILCSRCGSTVCVHLGYDMCPICRM